MDSNGFSSGPFFGPETLPLPERRSAERNPAVREAIRTATEIMKDGPDGPQRNMAVDVRDESGFSVRDGDKDMPDGGGLELPERNGAVPEAIRTATEIIKGAVPDGPERNIGVDVRDEGGQPVPGLRSAYGLNRSADG